MIHSCNSLNPTTEKREKKQLKITSSILWIDGIRKYITCGKVRDQKTGQKTFTVHFIERKLFVALCRREILIKIDWMDADETNEQRIC